MLYYKILYITKLCIRWAIAIDLSLSLHVVNKIKFTKALYSVWYILYDIIYSISDFVVFFPENSIKCMDIHVAVL
jgi:hypothetical protein